MFRKKMEYRQNNNDKIMWNMNLFAYKKKKDSPHFVCSSHYAVSQQFGIYVLTLIQL